MQNWKVLGGGEWIPWSILEVEELEVGDGQ